MPEVFDRLPLAVTVIDGGGQIAYVNEAATKLLGASREELIGASALTMTVGASDTTAAIELAAGVAAGVPWIGRFPLTGPDGRRIEAWYAAAPHGDGLLYIGGDTDDLFESLGIAAPGAVDADRTREAEDANRLVTTLIDAVPVGMAFFDRDARMIRVNAALARMDGVEQEAHVGSTLNEVLHRVPPEVSDAVTSVFTTGETIPDRLIEVMPAAGAERHWIMSFYPVCLRGAIAWVGATATEVTEWRRAEQERVRLLEAEQAAREAAEDAASRLARLQQVTARLAEAIDVDTVADVMVTYGAEGVDAIGAALLVATGDRRHVEVVGSMGFAEDAVDAFRVIAIDDDLPIAQAIRDRDVLLITSPATRDATWPALSSVTKRSQTHAVVPLFLDDRVVGAIALGWASERSFSTADRDFLVALGRQCVLALERVRLYEAERKARAAAEEARERMAFLAEASRVLGSSLDYNQTLARVAELAATEIAHACVIHLMHGTNLDLVGVAHRDPSKSPALRDAAGRRTSEPRLLGVVAASGSSRLVDDMTPEVIAAIAIDDEHAQAITSLDLGSMIIAPLVASGRVLGVLSLGSAADEPRYDHDDLLFVQDLAARVAVALQNSLTHEASSEVARTLQRSLLPPVQPRIPGLEIAQRYHSVGDIDVGGDFFDVFPAGDGRWGVVMGDVCGRGAAAASLTALVRYTVRAATIDEGEPTQVLHLLNRAIIETAIDERFCTITHAIVEPVAAGARLRLACGGHPLPLVLRASGAVEEAGEPGTAIGLFEELDITEVDVELGRGDAIVFFTDGLTEARAPDGRFAPDLLERVLSAAAGGTASELADAIDQAVLAFEGGHPRDDMALLILRVPTPA